MRVKVQRPNAMEDKTSDLPEFICRLCHDIQTFNFAANNAVLSLYAISYICWSTFGTDETQRVLAGKLMAVVGALSALREMIDATPERSLLSSSDAETLKQSIVKCEPIINKIEAAVQKLDEYMAAQPEKHTKIVPPGMYNAFNLGTDKEPAGILSECFCAAMRAVATVRAELLSGHGELTPKQSSEAFRLKQALPNSDLHPAVKQTTPFVCSQGFRQAAQSSTLFGQPPALQQQSQFQHIEPSQAFRDFHNLKPSPNPAPLPSASTTAKMSLFDVNIGSSNNKPSLSGTPQHLEAYILRPTIESSPNSSVTCSYRIELLPLDHNAIQAHVTKLGSGYSIIEAVAELSPEQLRLVQERTKIRGGHLLSVQYGAATDVVTPMGTLKVKPVVFVVKTSSTPEVAADSKGAPAQVSCFPHFAHPPATSTTPPIFGRFGNATTPFAPAPSNFADTQAPTIKSCCPVLVPATDTTPAFYGATEPTSSPFGTSTNPFGANAKPFGLFNNAPASAPQPAGFSFGTSTLQPSHQDTLCKHEEKKASDGSTEQYMMLPTFSSGPTTSFEEVRLDDYRAGRKDANSKPQLFGSVSAQTQTQTADSHALSGAKSSMEENTAPSSVFGKVPVNPFGRQSSQNNGGAAGSLCGKAPAASSNMFGKIPEPASGGQGLEKPQSAPGTVLFGKAPEA